MVKKTFFENNFKGLNGCFGKMAFICKIRICKRNEQNPERNVFPIILLNMNQTMLGKEILKEIFVEETVNSKCFKDKMLWRKEAICRPAKF